MKKNYRCFALYSGGLDSMIAAHLMRSLGFEVVLITFRSEFFNRKTKAGNYTVNIGEFDFSQIVIEITQDYLELLKNPKYGFGKNMNPCIDCKILFLSKAKALMSEHDIDFIVTGEVIGQRPKSQKSQPLKSIIRDAEVQDILIRPLSISHFPENEIEKKGIIDRTLIMEKISVEGRGRSKQIEYARINNIKDYSSPGGGCFLTHGDYCKKLRPLIESDIRDMTQYRLLKTGRHFNVSQDTDILKKFIIGKDLKENIFIESQKKGFLIRLADEIPGPVSILLYDSFTEDEWIIMSRLHLRYADVTDKKSYDMKITDLNNGNVEIRNAFVDNDFVKNIMGKIRL